jgi:hypothetical protein
MANRNHPIVLQVPEQMTGPVNPIFKTLGSASGMLNAFPKLALHMMITFYLVLIIMAIIIGPQKPPSLMVFVLYWHLTVIPAWILRSLTLWLCKTPLGMLVCFAAFLLLLLLFQQDLTAGLETIKTWIRYALREF